MNANPMIKSLILLADDEDLVLDVAKAMIEYLGYEVITAKNGEEALQIFKEKQESIQLVILDISMPGMDGLACIGQIRQISPIPALIASGLSQTISEEFLQQHQVQGILPKPFTLDLLQQTIEHTLSLSH